MGLPMTMGNDPMTKKSRELYIGNLPDGVPEAQLMSFLNAALLQAGMNLQPGMPITSVRCNGRFAFAEFRNAEETTHAMNLNGIVIVGQALNVGRPSAYTGPPTQNIRWEQLMAQRIEKHPELADTAIGLAGAGGAVMQGGGGGHACSGDPSTKICRELYIGNMPEGVNDVKMTQFFNDEMRRRNMIDNNLPGPNACIQARINGRFAFVEFRSIEETDQALTLNGAMFSGCSLRVGRPKAYMGPPGSAQAQQAAMMAGAGMNTMGGLGGGTPTVAIQMQNMVTVEELRDDEEFADLVEDIRGEMEKYGPVDTLEIPRPPVDGEVPEGCGIIYVKFKEVTGAIKAQLELEGRTFGGNCVTCSFYPEDLFDKQEWCDIVERNKPKPEPVAPEAGDGHTLPANLLGGYAPVAAITAD